MFYTVVILYNLWTIFFPNRICIQMYKIVSGRLPGSIHVAFEKMTYPLRRRRRQSDKRNFMWERCAWRIARIVTRSFYSYIIDKKKLYMYVEKRISIVRKTISCRSHLYTEIYMYINICLFSATFLRSRGTKPRWRF